jgi:glycosyltransferase involved in cell wall biosynthesis
MTSSDSDDFEVVYVDNNSSDGTRDELARLCEGRPQFRFFKEERQGSSFARNRGTQEARGEYVWYMDDDSLPEKPALQAYLAALPQWKPDVATGDIVPKANTPIPWWFDIEAKQFNAYLARTNFVGATRLLESGHAWGPNMVIRKSALIRASGFNENLGVFGEKRGGGEEEELQNRIFQSGGRLLYVQGAAVVHLVLPKQMEISRYLRQRIHRGESEAIDLFLLDKSGIGSGVTAVKCGGHAGSSMVLLLMGQVAAAVDHLGACFGLYGKWSKGRKLAQSKLKKTKP